MKKTLRQKALIYRDTNLKTQPLICLYIYGGSRYRMLSINEKINLRASLMESDYLSDSSFKKRYNKNAFKRVSTANYY